MNSPAAGVSAAPTLVFVAFTEEVNRLEHVRGVGADTGAQRGGVRGE